MESRTLLGLAAIGDEHRAFARGSLGLAGVLIEFPAGKRGDGHGPSPM